MIPSQPFSLEFSLPLGPLGHHLHLFILNGEVLRGRLPRSEAPDLGSLSLPPFSDRSVPPLQNQIAETLRQSLSEPDECNTECAVGKARGLFSTCVVAQQEGAVTFESALAAVAPLMDTLGSMEAGNATLEYALATVFLSGKCA